MSTSREQIDIILDKVENKAYYKGYNDAMTKARNVLKQALEKVPEPKLEEEKEEAIKDDEISS